MKTISLPISGAKTESRLSTWVKKDNALLSAIMGQSVSNNQFLLLLNSFTSFIGMVVAEHLGCLLLIVCLVWFIASIYSCRKGGLR